MRAELARRAIVLCCLAYPALAASGGGNGGGHAERTDRPAVPPAGWRTVRNERAGFTISVPRSWRARTKKTATLVRSSDRLVALTVAADRSQQGRDTPPPTYARELLQDLPDFEGSVDTRVRRVPGTPYRTARVEGAGTLRTSSRQQRITVAAYSRPGAVTYSAVVFRNALAVRRSDDRVVDGTLRSFRAQPPQRSGRSG